MSGQSASLSLKEACAMQHRIQASGSQAGKSEKSGSSSHETHKKEKGK